MHKIKVLVVEDQMIIAHDIQGLLTDWGYDVIGCAASGKEALRLFDTHQPDLALVDVNIEGEWDGIETVNRFQSKRAIPVVYLTAQADIETVSRAKESNPFAYVLKPFDERNLQISLDLAIDLFTKQNNSQQTVTEGVADVRQDFKFHSDHILQSEDAIFFKQNYRFVKLKKDDLVLIQADRNHSVIYTKQHKYIVRMPLTTVIERLQIPFIVRVHRSYAVNIHQIEEFNDSEIIISGKSIPFTSAYRADFIKHFDII